MVAQSVAKNSTLILAFACALPACALAVSSNDEAPRQAALQWLQVADSGKYNDAATMISNYARRSRDWPKYLASQRASLGRIKHRQLAEMKHTANVADDPETRQHAIVRFSTAFEKVIASEEVVLAKTGCCWEVCDYKILPAQKQ
jgi:hypothetical protein